MSAALQIPDAALSQHVAIVAQTGAGKSYATRGIVESLLTKRRRVCVLDYTGVWWGLRSSHSGKTSGFPVVIFGGEHADVPLNDAAGPVVAKFVAHGEVPSVIDLDGMTVGAQQRFVTAFLEELYRLNSRPLHLVIEEVDEFAPQTGAKGTERMVGATARIFQRGRKKGFRAIAITQRPANCHKRVLAQCKTLVALRLVHPRDREAIEDWISGHAATGDASSFVESLAGLSTGEGFVWAPEQRILERVKFPAIKTFDSMKAPDDGDAVEPAKWAAVDLEAVRSQMAAFVQQAEADDPARLRAEIAELKRQIAAASKKAPPKPDTAALEAEFRRGYAEASNAARERLEPLLRDFEAFRAKFAAAAPPENSARPYIPPRPAAAPVSGLTPGGSCRVRQETFTDWQRAEKTDGLPSGERAVLTAIAQNPAGAGREQIGILSGYKRATRDAYILRLRVKGYVSEQPDGDLIATAAGLQALGDFEPLPTGAELRDYWRQKLPAGERAIFEALLRRHPYALERGEFDGETGYKRATRDAYILRLRTRRLVTVAGTKISLSEHLQ